MKKIKLILSLCIMCLSVAVLCMGVLAINSITYNISGTMTYNMIDGIALVNTRVYKVAGTESSLSTVCSTLSTKTFEEIEQTSGYVLSQKLDTKATLSDSATQTEVSSGSISIDFGATDSSVYYYTYYIVINITNLSNTGTLSTTLTDKTSYASGVTKSYVSSQTSIEKNDTKNIVIGLSIPSTTTDEINSTISYSLTVSFSKYQCTLDGTTIYFTKDMTWAGYVASLSDSSNFDTSGTYLKYNSKTVQISSSNVKTTDAIIDGGIYDLVSNCITIDDNSIELTSETTWAELSSEGTIANITITNNYVLYNSKYIQKDSTFVKSSDTVNFGNSYSSVEYAFTWVDIPYVYQNGQTWQEFVDSDYNVTFEISGWKYGNFSVGDYGSILGYDSSIKQYVHETYENAVKASDVIQNYYTYCLGRGSKWLDLTNSHYLFAFYIFVFLMCKFRFVFGTSI